MGKGKVLPERRIIVREIHKEKKKKQIHKSEWRIQCCGKWKIKLVTKKVRSITGNIMSFIIHFLFSSRQSAIVCLIHDK